MEEGQLVAEATARPGFRLFEIFRQHHWSGTYYTEDGFIVPPDRPIFESQIIHLDDPTKKRKPSKSKFSPPPKRLMNLKKMTETMNLKNRNSESKLSSNMGEWVMMKCSSTYVSSRPNDDLHMW